MKVTLHKIRFPKDVNKKSEINTHLCEECLNLNESEVSIGVSSAIGYRPECPLGNRAEDIVAWNEYSQEPTKQTTYEIPPRPKKIPQKVPPGWTHRFFTRLGDPRHYQNYLRLGGYLKKAVALGGFIGIGELIERAAKAIDTLGSSARRIEYWRAEMAKAIRWGFIPELCLVTGARGKLLVGMKKSVFSAQTTPDGSFYRAKEVFRSSYSSGAAEKPDRVVEERKAEERAGAARSPLRPRDTWAIHERQPTKGVGRLRRLAYHLACSVVKDLCLNYWQGNVWGKSKLRWDKKRIAGVFFKVLEKGIDKETLIRAFKWRLYERNEYALNNGLYEFDIGFLAPDLMHLERGMDIETFKSYFEGRNPRDYGPEMSEEERKELLESMGYEYKPPEPILPPNVVLDDGSYEPEMIELYKTQGKYIIQNMEEAYPPAGVVWIDDEFDDYAIERIRSRGLKPERAPWAK